MKLNQKPLRALLLLIPIILGMIGLFVLEKEPFMDALFRCVQMYVLNYSDTPPNLFVEAARWIARRRTIGDLRTFGQGAVVRILANLIRVVEARGELPASLRKDWIVFN